VEKLLLELRRHSCRVFHAPYEQYQLAVPSIAARRVAGFEVLQQAAMSSALFSAHQPSSWLARFRLRQQMPQSRRENRDRAAATVLENHHVEIGMRDHSLKTEQTNVWIQDEALQRGPSAFASPTALKADSRRLDSHGQKSLDYTDRTLAELRTPTHTRRALGASPIVPRRVCDPPRHRSLPPVTPLTDPCNMAGYARIASLCAALRPARIPGLRSAPRKEQPHVYPEFDHWRNPA